MRRLAYLALLGLVLAVLPLPARALEEEEIVLKDGTVFHGRVLERVVVRGRRMLRVETDFGEVRVDEREVRRRPRGEPTEGVFFFERIRVARLRGVVERRTAENAAWVRVRLQDEYGPVLNAPDAIVKPGDTVRTSAGASIDLMPHRGVWVRVRGDSEIQLPAEPGDVSFALVRGTTLQRIEGKPRGKTFVTGLPSRRVVVSGTEFLVAVGHQERVSVTHGEVEVGSGPKVGAKQTGRWKDAEEVDVDVIDPDDVDALDVEAVALPEEDMVYVPGGKYRMGGLGDKDAPARTVVLTGFLVDKREVAADEYARYAVAMQAPLPSYFVGGKPPAGQERQPVYHVSLVMAQGYLAWAGRRVPTEAQWEAAARGPKGLKFPWGGRDLPKSAALGTIDLANPGANEPEVVNALLEVDVPTEDVSPFGLHGMVSSVSEWVRDLYADDYYTRGEDKDPQGPRTGVLHCVRGQSRSSTRRLPLPDNDERRPTGFRGVVETD